MLRGNIEIAAGIDVIGLNAGCAAITCPVRGPVVRSGPGSARLHLSVKQDAMIRHLAALLDEPVGVPLEFASAMPINRGYGRSLADSLRLAAADGDDAGGILINPLASSAFEQFVLTALLVSHPHNYTDALRRRERPLAPRAVKRAIDYIQAHLDEPIGLYQIVAASGVPGRTLLKHFRDFRGTSPMGDLRQARFQKVHQALRRAAPEEEVTGIAAAHGFTHMGRFSVEYREPVANLAPRGGSETIEPAPFARSQVFFNLDFRSPRGSAGLAQADWRLLRRLLLDRGGAPPQDRLARCRGFVEPPTRRQIGGISEDRRVARFRPRREPDEHSGELIERGLALRFGRLDQQGAVHDERKIHRHRVEALVDQRLREIEGRDPGVLQEFVVEQHLVHADAGKGRAQSAG